MSYTAKMHALLLLLGALLGQAQADCTGTTCATCITQQGGTFVKTQCYFCALTGECNDVVDTSLNTCVARTTDGNDGWNTDTCKPSCPGNPNCPKCDPTQVPHSDHGTAATACAQRGRCLLGTSRLVKPG